MATAPNPPAAGPSPWPWLEYLSRNRQRFAHGLLAAAALCAIPPVWFAIQYQWQYWFICLWGALLALTALGCGLYLVAAERSTRTGTVDDIRVLVLVLGGLAGLFTFLMGVALTYQWWEAYFAGGLEAWREHWRRLFTCVMTVFGGLVLMFLSLLLGRVDERSNPSMRRLLYGYNAILSSLLLLAILGLINVLVYVQIGPFKVFSRIFDWTASNNFSLSAGTVSILEHLDKPVRVYVMLPRRGVGPLGNDISNLLDSCRSRTDKIEVEYLSPQRHVDRIESLMDRYQLIDPYGVLLVYGSGTGETHEFAPIEELRTSDFDPMTHQNRYQFTGEDALMRKLRFLMEGKSKGVIYVTQGNGELSLGGPVLPGRRDMGSGLSILQRRLQRDNYEVRPLDLKPGVDKVPDDASVVIVARPTTPLPESAVQALTDYMTQAPADPKKKGRLIVLLDRATPQTAKFQTGLEKLLAEFNVQVGNDRVLSLLQGVDIGKPGDVLTLANPESDNPIAVALNRAGVTFFLFENPRTVRPLAPPGGAPSRFTVQELVITLPQQYAWVETNLGTDALEIMRQLSKEIRSRVPVAKMTRAISPNPLPVAVAVSERDFGPRIGGPSPEQPRLVVFGDASWLTNPRLEDGAPMFQSHYELITDTLAWLRERPTMGVIADPKQRKFYSLEKVPPEVAGRTKWLPAMLLLVGIIGVGTGVWVVRRR
jgi:hypothetical protein